MRKEEMIKDGFWHDYISEDDRTCWREYKWCDINGYFIYRSKI